MGPMVVTMNDVRLPTHPNGWVIDKDGKAIVPKYMYYNKRFWKWRAAAEQGTPEPPPIHITHLSYNIAFIRVYVFFDYTRFFTVRPRVFRGEILPLRR
jgi:hypothetical protein